MDETAGVLSFDVVLTADRPEDVTVRYRTVPGSATPGTDYEEASGLLVFTPGQTRRTVEIQVLDDQRPEGNETFRLELFDEVGLVLGEPSAVEVTIVNDDFEIDTVTFSVGVGTGNLLTTPIGVDIADGTATFTRPLPAAADRGDRVDVDGLGAVYLGTCSSDTVCQVFNGRGYDAGGVIGGTASSISRAFPSLADAVTDASDSAHLDTLDLVSADASLQFLCYGGSADTNPVAIDGWITSPETAIRIEAPTADLLRGAGQRHLGRWTNEAYRLEVYGSECLRTSVGNLTIDGLQLYCGGDPGASVAGIRLDDISGDVEIAETLIRLDDTNGSGERIGVAASAAAPSNVVIRNSVMWDLGSGQGDPQTGILVGSSNVTMLAANNTIAGGRNSIVNIGGAVTAINNLMLAPMVAGVDGDLEPESRLNLGAESSSPNPPANTVGPIVMTNPVRGQFADFHLACSVLDLEDGEDVVVTEGFYPDEWRRLFDGASETLAVTPPIDKAIVLLEFAEPRAIVGTGIAFSNADAHEWAVEAAMTVEDLTPGSATYLELVKRTDVNHRERARAFVSFPTPQEFRVIKLTAWRDGENVNNVHIGEWWLEGLNPACGQGDDLSTLASDSFANDVDGNARLGAWDIGADQSNELTVGFVDRGPVEWWEKEGAARVQVMLSEPAPVPVSVRYSTLDGSARADADYEVTRGTLVFEPGEVSKIISVPLEDDGAWESVEDFWVEFFDAVGARLESELVAFRGSRRHRSGAGPIEGSVDGSVGGGPRRERGVRAFEIKLRCHRGVVGRHRPQRIFLDRLPGSRGRCPVAELHRIGRRPRRLCTVRDHPR